ncbi:hypothetical protein [Undibacterium squillarum]|uniref:hypothetical protein n=1 Tax=Undibacterium squillarum TaxID=1131567 RepID=UPI0035AE5DB8
MKKLSLEEMQEIARSLTQKELERYVIPDDMRGQLALTTLFEGDDRVFVLYVPAEKRSDAYVIARTRVNAISGNASVEISGLKEK